MPIYTIKAPSGHEIDIDAPDEATAVTGAQQWYAQNVTNKTDESMLGALSQGASDVAQGVGKTVKDYISPEAGKAILDAKSVQSDPKYKSASEGFMYPQDGADKHVMGLDWSKLPRAALEQAPGLALDLGVQALVPKWMGPVGKYAANALTFGARTAGSEAEKRAVARTGDQNAEPNAEDKLIGLGSTGAQAVLNQVGLNKIISPAKVTASGMKGVAQAAGNVVMGGLAEGGTSGAQNLISQGAATAGTDKGLTIDPQELKGSAVLGTIGGGVFASPRGAKDAAASVRFRDVAPDQHAEMAANRILDKVAKPSDLEDPKKAYEATKAAISDATTEFRDAAATVTNPSKEAHGAIERAKKGEGLTEKDIAAIDREGNDSLSSLARQITHYDTLTSKGSFDTASERFAGGVGEFARRHAGKALSSLAGVGALPHIVAQGGIGLDTLASSIPGMAQGLAGGFLGYKAMKKIETMAGVQSPARTFAEKFGSGNGVVRPDVPLNQSPTGPKVVPQNSLTPSQPWGPVPDAPQRFKPDIVEPGIAKIVEKLQNQKRRDTANAAMPLLRQLAEQNQPAPAPQGPDANAMNEQVKSALLMASARRKIEGQRQAESEASASPMINEQGGLDAVSNPAMGKRANELISAANALARLRRQPEEQASPPIAPEQPPQSPQPGPAPQAPPQSIGDILRRLQAGAQPEAPKPQAPTPEPFVLPESPHVFKTPKDAAHAIHAEAVAGGKEIRNAEGYKAGTTRRLTGEEAIYNTISNSLSSVKERGDFHKYLSALWGSDSPEVVTKVRDHMLAEFPQHADTISKHLSDEAIKGLWTKPKKKK